MSDDIRYDRKAAGKFLGEAERERLGALAEALAAAEPWTADAIEATFQDVLKRLDVKLGKLAQPARVALTGGTVSPGIFEMCEVLGKDRTVSRLQSGGKIGAEASLNKIFWSELDVEMHETALEILGWRAELLPSAPLAGEVGEWLDGYLFALAGPIYAGTNEIQRNVIAERILGLPRS